MTVSFFFFFSFSCNRKYTHFTRHFSIKIYYYFFFFRSCLNNSGVIQRTRSALCQPMGQHQHFTSSHAINTFPFIVQRSQQLSTATHKSIYRSFTKLGVNLSKIFFSKSNIAKKQTKNKQTKKQLSQVTLNPVLSRLRVWHSKSNVINHI